MSESEVLVPLKTVSQPYSPDQRARRLMQQYRGMVNYVLEAGLRKGIRTREGFRAEYHYLREVYRLESSLVQSAIGHAAGLLQAKHKAEVDGHKVKDPRCLRPFLRANESVRIRQGVIDMPELLRVPLSERTLKVIGGREVRSVVLTQTKIHIVYANCPEPVPANGLLAIDLNLRNITTFESSGRIDRFDISELSEISMTYREILSHFKRHDNRVRQELYQKYGFLERSRVHPRLHEISTQIVEYAEANGLAIVVEDLTGLRERFTREAGGSTDSRARMNHWPYGELLFQIEYKANWKGIRVITVAAADTSSRCYICHKKGVTRKGSRIFWCPSCKLLIDRDMNAARNILARALGHGADGRTSEAKRDRESASPEVDMRQLGEADSV